MDFLEVLKTQSLSEEQIKAIAKAMRKSRIFITSEEKIEERYHKMKLQRDSLRKRLDLAEKALKNIPENVEINEDIQRIRKAFEEKIISIKNSYEDKITDMTLDMAIQSKLANVKYPELLISKFDKSKLSIEVDGTILGFEEQLSAMRRTYKDLFPD